MRLGPFRLWWAVAVCAAASDTNLSTNVTEILAQMQADLAPSALQCIVTNVLASPCAITDFPCICSNAPLSLNIEACLLQNCTVLEQLATLKFQKGACGVPPQDIGASTKAITITLYAMAVIAVIARLVARLPVLGAQFYWDDWIIVACLAGLTPVCVIAIIMIDDGLGRDIWTLEPESITNVLFFFWIEEFLYTFEVVFTKLSLLFLYLRIFPSAIFRLQCKILGVIVLAFGIACVVSSLLLCAPVSYNWEQWDGKHEGHCANVNAQVYAMAGINMALDLCIFILPIPQLIPLEMKWKRKAAVILMFLVGLFVTGCSVYRLQSLLQFGRSTNPTFDYTRVGVWSIIEIDVGVICTCMPGIAALLRRVWPRVFKSIMGSEVKKSGSGESESRSRSRLARLGSLSPHKMIAKTTHVSVEYRTQSDTRSEELELVDRLPHAYSRFDQDSLRSEQKPGAYGNDWKSEAGPQVPSKPRTFCPRRLY